METKFRTIREVTELLGVSRPTLHKFTKSGELPAHKFGRSVRYSDSDIAAFLQSRRTIPAPRS